MERYTKPYKLPTPESEFEKRLYEGGSVLSLTPGADLDQELNNYLGDILMVRSTRGQPDENLDIYLIESFLRLSIEGLAWKYRYRGRLPGRWAHAINIQEDLEAAEQEQATLSPLLLEACVTHPNYYLAIKAARRQILPDYLLEMISMGDLPEWAKDEIRTNQAWLADQQQVQKP